MKTTKFKSTQSSLCTPQFGIFGKHFAKHVSLYDTFKTMTRGFELEMISFIKKLQ